MNGEFRTGFRENGSAGFGLQPFQNGFFCNGLAISGAHKPAARALGRNMKEFGSAYEPFPRNGTHQLKQVFKGQTLRLRHDEINSVTEAKPQITREHVLQIGLEPNEAVFRLNVSHA